MAKKAPQGKSRKGKQDKLVRANNRMLIWGIVDILLALALLGVYFFRN